MNGSIWVLSYVLLWAAVGVLGCTVVALLRQIGMLHTRIAPMGVNFAGEGPALDEPAPEADGVDYSDSPVTLLAFTSPTCEICAALKPSLERIGRTYDDIELRLIDHGDEADLFTRFEVRSTPYLVAVDADGIVRSRGVANTLDQAEEMLAEVLAGPPIDIDADTAEPDVDAETDAGADVDVDAEPVVQL
jgi:glutaredoxin